MKKKNEKKKEVKVDKVEEAQRILIEENKKKVEAFINEYRALCFKHGLEVVPVAGLDVKAMRNK